MKAPEFIPGHLYQEYTMFGEVGVEYSYRNDCSIEIQNEINENFTKEKLENSIERIKNKEQNYYGYTDTWLYECLEKYPIDDKEVCIIGSTFPWYEAMCLVYGAKKCTVIEYSDRKSFHPLIEYKKPADILDKKFDVCLSISSFEHDGLGRYGDPINPNGDLESMTKMKDVIKKEGLMVLSIPMGNDKLYFNTHRVYGKKRFPLLIEGWEKIDEFGIAEGSYDNDINGVNGTPYQPVFILRSI